MTEPVRVRRHRPVVEAVQWPEPDVPAFIPRIQQVPHGAQPAFRVQPGDWIVEGRVLTPAQFEAEYERVEPSA
jgi:hypothetical protein